MPIRFTLYTAFESTFYRVYLLRCESNERLIGEYRATSTRVFDSAPFYKASLLRSQPDDM